MDIKKITKDERDFFEVKTSEQKKTVDGKTVEIYSELQILEVVDLEGRKRMLEKMISEHQAELDEIKKILTGIKNIENDLKKLNK